MGFLIIIFLIKRGMASGGDMIIKVSNVNAMLTKEKYFCNFILFYISLRAKLYLAKAAHTAY